MGLKFDGINNRFRPIYWMPFAIISFLVGDRAFWYFLVNTAVLCVTTVALVAFVRRAGMTHAQAWASGTLFVLSGPVIENFYTLSKGEWLQVMFIALSLLTISAYDESTSKRWQTGIVTGSAFLLLLAMGSKETSMVMLPIGMTWFGIAWIWSRSSQTDKFGWRRGYLLSSILASAAYLVLRFAFTSSVVETSGYTERFVISIGQLIASGVRWAGWLICDFSYLAGIYLICTVVLIRRQKIAYIQTMVDMSVWMAAWIVVYLPWNFMTEYYMLPFALGATIFVGSVLGDSSIWRVRSTQMIGSFSIALIVVTVINNCTSARIQLTVDSINDQLMNAVSSLPPQSTVLINIQSQNEYSDQIPLQLEARFGRDDLIVELFDPDGGLPGICQPGYCFIITPVVKNQPLMTVRMGVFEPTQDDWNDDLQIYLKNLSGWEKDQVLIDSFQMLTVDFPRLFCGLIETRAFCATPSPFLDTRQFQYGWIVFKLEN